MRVIQWILLIGCLVSGCSNQKTEDVSQQANEGFLTPPPGLNLPDLDDWPENGTLNSTSFRSPQDLSTLWKQRQANVPFSRPF